MKYQAPQVLASYSLNAPIATARAADTFSQLGLPAIPNGSVYFLGSGFNGYLSSVTYSHGNAAGHYFPF